LNTTTGTNNNYEELAYNTIGISASGNGLSAILQAEVYLHSTTGTTKTCFGYSFDLHGEVDAPGSKDELVK
jgi:hypothetical protein